MSTENQDPILKTKEEWELENENALRAERRMQSISILCICIGMILMIFGLFLGFLLTKI